MDRTRGHLAKNVKEATSSLTWIKIVGIGSTGTGKTSLIKYFCENKFSPGYQATVGVDYGFKVHNVQGNDLRVHLWDLSGASEYLDVRNELYAATDAVFLTYDVTNATSFESLDAWWPEMVKYGLTGVEMCLVANKMDVRDRQLLLSNEGRKWAASHKMMYYETSCANGEGVDAMFLALLQAVLRRRGIQPKDARITE